MTSTLANLFTSTSRGGDSRTPSGFLRSPAAVATACALWLACGQAHAEDQPRAKHKAEVAPLLQTRTEEDAEPVDNLGDNSQPEVAGPEIPDGAFYGPPAPRSKKGKVGQIEWTDPTVEVPPALVEAVHIVTANYPSALAARAALRASEADVRAARWQRFPSLTVDLQYLDDEHSPQPVLRVTQPLWAGGRIGANIRRNKAQEDVSSAGYVETVVALAVKTTETYFEIARLTERERLLKESESEHQRLVETMERRVKQEISPLADLELARSRLAQVQQEYNVTRAQRLSNLRVLADLIADPTYDLGPMPHYDENSVLTNLDALDDQAVAYDPTIHRLYAEADVARADRDSSKALLFPQINAEYTRDEFIGSRIGVVVRSQTQGGLSQFSDVRAASLRIDSAIEKTRVAEQQLRRDIESLVIQYEAARARASISQSAASTAGRVSASYTRQFIAGRRSWLDVMNALREAISAQIAQSDAEMAVMSSATKLELQSGRWRPYFAETSVDPGIAPDTTTVVPGIAPGGE